MTVFTYIQIIVVCFITEYALFLYVLSQVRRVNTGYLHSQSVVDKNNKTPADVVR